MWLRFHRLPKKVRRIREEFRSPKLRWLASRSKERYDLWPEGLHTIEAMRAACIKGEIGRIDGFRIIRSEIGQGAAT